MDLKGRTQLFTRDDIVEGSNYVDYTNQIVVVSEYHVNDNWKPEFKHPEFQLFYAQGGFGCSPTTSGNAVFGTFLADGEEARVERFQIAGILKPELVEEYGIEVKKSSEN